MFIFNFEDLSKIAKEYSHLLQRSNKEEVQNYSLKYKKYIN